MKSHIKIMTAALAGCLLCACGALPVPSAGTPPVPPTSTPPITTAAPTITPSSTSAPSTTPPTDRSGNAYIRQLADDTLANLNLVGKDDFGKIQAVYEHLIATTYFAPPLGLDSWQLHGGEAPGYLENRALSPLAYGVGSCEDYASAMVVLLEQLGFESRYVPGITISVHGDFVDHAWAAVRVREDWYHLDPQLEDNVMKDGLLGYRYFLKTDQELLPDHRWGESLLEHARLTDRQRQAVELDYLLPFCNRRYPAPTSRKLDCLPRPDIATLTAAIAAERAAYEVEHGKLPQVTLDIVPPVFGNTGYGPPDS